MFPIKAQELPLHKIADYWSRDRFLGATKKELQARLEEAWLRGELPVTKSDARLRLLKVLHKFPEDRFLFLRPNSKGPSAVKHADGSVEIDIRIQIPIPKQDSTKWTDEICGGAYTALADKLAEENQHGVMTLLEMVPDLAKPPMRALTARQSDFLAWIKKEGYPTPEFWGPVPAAKTSQALPKSKGLSPQKAKQKVKEKYGPFGEGKNPVPSQTVVVKFFSKSYPGCRSAFRQAVTELKGEYGQRTGVGRPQKRKK